MCGGAIARSRSVDRTLCLVDLRLKNEFCLHSVECKNSRYFQGCEEEKFAEVYIDFVIRQPISMRRNVFYIMNFVLSISVMTSFSCNFNMKNDKKCF